MKLCELFLAKLLVPKSDLIYSVLRIVSGLAFAFHGMQKVLGILTTKQPEVMSQLWIGGVIELVAGVLIAAGFLTRLSAFIASGTMAVAYIQFHWKFEFDENIFPAVNRGELAFVYCFLFLYIAARGNGKGGLELGKS